MPTDPTDEDALAAYLADAAIRLVEESYGEAEGKLPRESAKFRRRIARLYLRQLTGSEHPPEEITEAAVAKSIGLTKQRASEIKHTALAKLYIALRQRHPDLF